MSTDLPFDPATATSFTGWKDFAQTIRYALDCAQAQGWPSMVWSDADYTDWPLGERALNEALHAWARQGRTLVMLAGQFDQVQRQHHRFITWRRTWDHVIECRVCRPHDGNAIPSALWSPHWGFQRLDLERSRGVVLRDALGLRTLQELLQEHRRQSSPGLAATTLGL